MLFRSFEGAEGVELGGGDAQPVALAEQRTGLDEAERQALGLEPEVAGPVGLVVGEGAADRALQELEGGAPAEAGQVELLHVGVGRGGGDVGPRGEEEGALGGGGEELVEGGAAELQVVDDHDGADLAEPVEERGTAGPVVRGVPDGDEELVEEFEGGAVVAGEPDDSVGGDVGAVGGDGVEEGGAAGSRGAGQPVATLRKDYDWRCAPPVIRAPRGLRRSRAASFPRTPDPSPAASELPAATGMACRARST